MVDEQDVVKGIVSLSDILQALVLTDGEEGKYSYADVKCLHVIYSCANHIYVFLNLFDFSAHRHSLRKLFKHGKAAGF